MSLLPFLEEGCAAGPDGLLELSEEHGVTALLEQELASGPGRDGSDAFQSRLRELRTQRNATHLLRQTELRRVLEALGRRGIRPLLLKGVPLSYLIYPFPTFRPSLDTDLLVKKGELSEAAAAMGELGYVARNGVSGELISHETAYEYKDAFGAEHVLDVHWKIANPHLFSELLGYEELSAHAIPVPALSPLARTLCPTHALLLACIHRVAHHHDQNRLIWLYDIHLLVQSMSEDETREFILISRHRGVSALCQRGILLAARYFQTVLTEPLAEFIVLPAVSGETTARYLKKGNPRLKEFVSNWGALPGLRSKTRYLGEYLFPPREYMLQKYPWAGRWTLPLAYGLRACQGVVKFLS